MALKGPSVPPPDGLLTEVLDADITALRPSAPFEPLPECREARLRFWIVFRRVVRSMLEDQAGRRAVSKNAPDFISQLSLSRTDAASAGNHVSFSFDQPGLRGDGPDERDFEFECGLRKSLGQHGLDSKTHAAVEQGCSQTSVNRAGGVQLPRMRFCRGNNASLRNLDDVIAKGLRHRVEGHSALDKTTNQFETAHCALMLGVDDAKIFHDEDSVMKRAGPWSSGHFLNYRCRWQGSQAETSETLRFLRWK
jgi:hypothetical protein